MPRQTSLDPHERERKATAARLRFEKATVEIAAEHRFGDPRSTEIEMLEEASRLVKDARPKNS